MERIQEVVKEELRTCKAEELDAARARVRRAGQLRGVEVLCTRDTDEGLRRVQVFAEQTGCEGLPQESTGRSSAGRQLTNCSKGVSCYPTGGGAQECDCR